MKGLDARVGMEKLEVFKEIGGGEMLQVEACDVVYVRSSDWDGGNYTSEVESRDLVG